MNTSSTDGFSALIADDEPLARRRIADLLKHHPEIHVLGQCATGPATREAVQTLTPDILFLDVQMPGLDGFEVLASLDPEERPVIVFSTAYDDYALAAFEVHAVDYLLKPYADERFEEALRRAKRSLRADRLYEWQERIRGLLDEVTDVSEGSALPQPDPDRTRLERFAVKREDRLAVVNTTDVDWIEAARDYVRLHVGREVHLIRAAIGELERRLDPVRFLRIHRSTIVQLDRVRELYADLHGDYVAVLQGGERLRVSRHYRDRTLARLGASR